MKQWLLMAAALFCAAPALAEPLVVYSARKEEMIKPLLDEFSKKNNVEVKLLSDESPKLIARMESEGASTPADVLLTVDVLNITRAANKNMLKAVQSAALEKAIPAEYRDPEGRWFGLGKRARIIFYNKEKVKPSELSTYEALAEPKWKGRIITRSSSNTYTQSLIASMVAAHGEAGAETWAKAVAQNLATPPKGGDIDLLKTVGAGGADITLANSYYYARLLNSTVPGEKELAQKVGAFFPNQKPVKGDMQGAHVNLSTGAVVASSKQPELAQKLLEFLISEQAQRFYADSNQEYPMNAKVKPSDTLQGLGKFKPDTVPMKALAENAQTAIAIADKAGWP